MAEKKVFVCKSEAIKYKLYYNNQIKDRALVLRKFNIKEMDSIHIAIAE